MQIQEMYWKQKYNCLEENYNALKNELKKQNTSKTKTGKLVILVLFYLCYLLFIYTKSRLL